MPAPHDMEMVLHAKLKFTASFGISVRVRV